MHKLKRDTKKIQNWEKLLTPSKAGRPCRKTSTNEWTGQSPAKVQQRILHLGWGNSGCTMGCTGMGKGMPESSTIERDLRVLVSGKLIMGQQSPGCWEGQMCPGDHQAHHHQLSCTFARCDWTWCQFISSRLPFSQKILPDDLLRYLPI